MAKSRRKKARYEARTAARDLELAHEASVVLDSILEGRIRAPGQLGVEVELECLRLMKISLKTHQHYHPRIWHKPGRKTGWTGKIGVFTLYETHGEHDYVCGFCRESLATIPNKGVGTIPGALVRRFETHGWSCGMRYLMERGGLLPVDNRVSDA